MASRDAGRERVPAGVEVATGLFILGVVSGTFLLGSLLRSALAALTGQSLNFDLPLAGKALGGALVILGLVAAGSTVRYRKPREVLDSTSVTLLKLIRQQPLGNPGARTEPFVPKGPYRWVRNPMYLGAVLIPLGLGVVFTSASFLLWGAVVLCWFMVLIPREEKELDALFGESYRAYKRQVPMLIPTGRRFRGEAQSP